LNHNFLPFYNRHKGKEGILLATGPTLNRYDYLEDNGSRIRVGVNSFVAEPRPIDYYFCGHVDDRSRAYMDRIRRSRAVKFGYTKVDGRSNPLWLTDRMALDLGLIPYEITTRIDFHQDLTSAPLVNQAINFSALQFMVWIGLKKIYLVGCDATSIISHRDNRVDKTRLVNRMLETWKAFQKFAQGKVDIVSVNPKGLRGMFPHRST